MTSEELDELRAWTIAGNKRTIARIKELQEQLEQIQVAHPPNMNRIEEFGAAIIERLDRLIQLNRDAIALANGGVLGQDRMSEIQEINIPDDLYKRLQRQARKRETTVDAVIVKALERQARRLEFREELVVEGGLIVTNDPYTKVARERAQRVAADGVNGSTRRGSKVKIFSVEILPEDLRKRFQRQASYLNTTLDKLMLDALEVEINTIESHERIAAGPVREFSISPSELLARERAQRDAPIDF